MIIDRRGLIKKQRWKKIKQKRSVFYFKLCNIKFKDDPCLVIKKDEKKLKMTVFFTLDITCVSVMSYFLFY